MSETDLRLIENPVRLSESKFWEIQRNYWKNMGIQAWKEEVPSYISTNAFIGYQYALLVFEYIKDTCRNHIELKDETFYIAELGAGTGKFSFFFLKAFKELLRVNNFEQKFCYIITDIVQKNLEFCEKNDSFTDYINNHELDFAQFNVEDGKDIELRLKGKTYSELQPKTPLIIIANYTFDCIKQDAFEINNGKLQEERTGLRSRYKNFDIKNARHLSDLRFTYQYYDIDLANYYSNPYLNEIMQEYATRLQDKNATIMIPLGAIQFLDHLKALTHGNYFMIVGDKGISQLERIPILEKKYRMTYDGCYSFFVNFHAMGEYIKKCGGDCLLSENDNSFKVCLFSQGASFNELKNTKASFMMNIENTGPDEFCYIYDEFINNNFRFHLKALISFLRLSRWDTNAYALIHDRLIELLPTADKSMQLEVERDLAKVRANIYHLNIGEDIYNYLGNIYQTQNQNEKAIELYQQSITHFVGRSAPHHNLGLIYDKERNTAKALYHYQKAYELDKRNRFAFKRVANLTGKPNWAVLLPLIKLTMVLGALGLVMYLLGRWH